MTGLITLVDGGQNYVYFDVVCGVIQSVSPSGLNGWKGTRIINKTFEVGNILKIDLQWDDYDLPLKYAIAAIQYQELAGGEWLRALMPAETIFTTCVQTGVDHEVYEVYIGEIPLYFDCLNHAALAAANALKDTVKMPAELMYYIDGVQLVDEDAPWDKSVIANLVEHFVTIFGGRIIDVGILAHEATHSWAKVKWGSTTPPDDTDFMAAIRSGEPPITEYAKTSPGEDLAESIRYYVVSPETFKNACPLRYDPVHKMMTDPDYYG